MVQSNGLVVRQDVLIYPPSLYSPTLFKFFLEQIMSDYLEEHDGKVSIGGRNITNLQFADSIHGLAEEEQELEALVERRQNLHKV